MAEPLSSRSRCSAADSILSRQTISGNSNVSFAIDPDEVIPDPHNDGGDDDDADLSTPSERSDSEVSPSEQKKLLASFDSVFTLFREVNPYLRSGFRRPSVCWRSALQSVTQVHNETANIWLHLIAGLWHTYLLVTEPYHPMMVTAVLTGAACFYLSAAYHTFRFMSPAAFKWWLKIDHMGCVVFIAGSNVTWLHIIYACQRDLCSLYSGLVLTAAALTIAVSFLPARPRDSLATLLGYKPYDVAEPFLVLTAWASLAGVLHHIYLRGIERIGMHFFVESMLYIFGFVFFATKLPERCWPRWFDIWGNSHQMWHLCIVLSDVWHISCVRYYAWQWNADC